jgi:hypothetical protein
MICTGQPSVQMKVFLLYPRENFQEILIFTWISSHLQRSAPNVLKPFVTFLTKTRRTLCENLIERQFSRQFSQKRGNETFSFYTDSNLKSFVDESVFILCPNTWPD